MAPLYISKVSLHNHKDSSHARFSSSLQTWTENNCGKLPEPKSFRWSLPRRDEVK